MAFADTWALLQTKLTVEMVVTNWTVLKGVFGTPFKIVDVSAMQIIVSPPGAATRQTVNKVEDFEHIYNHWDDYKKKRIYRKALGDSWRTKYVISIFHWLETENNGSLP